MTEILKTVCDEYYDGDTHPLLTDGLRFMKEDQVLAECVRILSDFGKQRRYHNLDVITGENRSNIDPKSEWLKLENKLEDIGPYAQDMSAQLNDYYPRVNAQLISVLERMVRAIALQLTLGGHDNRDGMVKQLSSVYMDFIVLREDQIGTVDYRRSVEILRRERHKWTRYREWRVLKSKWPSRVLHRHEFGDEWPFRSDRVIVQRKHSVFCLVFIEGYKFALNGAARDRFDLPHPFEAGEAILGKSIGPFIDIARSL